MTQPFNDTFEDDLQVIQKLGFPTFDEFKKNPDKYRKRPDELLECIDSGEVYFKERLQKITHYFRDSYKMDSIEQLERVCQLEGFSSSYLEPETKVKSLGGTGKHERFEVVCHWWPRHEFRLRGGIVANE